FTANERLRRKFAEKANAVGPWIERQMDSVTAIGMGMQGSLEDQLNKLKQFEVSVVQYRPHLDELEKCHQEIQEAMIFENRYTQYTMEVSKKHKLQFVDLKDVSSGFAAECLVGALFLVSTQFEFTFYSISIVMGINQNVNHWKVLLIMDFFQKQCGWNSLIKEKMEETVIHNKTMCLKICHNAYKLQRQLSKVDNSDTVKPL
ncbi:Alpha-actinin, partial [Araneus ventricosus]